MVFITHGLNGFYWENACLFRWLYAPAVECEPREPGMDSVWNANGDANESGNIVQAGKL